MTPDDAELLRRFVREGAKDAFGELVQRHLGVVYHAALRQVGGDPHRAEEVAQDVFTLLAHKAPALVDHTMLIGWLFATTRRTAWRLMRSEQRRLRREHEAWMVDEATADTNEAEWENLRPLLDEVLNQLKPVERDALLLRYFQEEPFAEIGQRFAVSEDAARMRVERALEKLRTRLVRRGVTSTSAALSLLLANNAVAAMPSGLVTSVTTVALSKAAAGGGFVALLTKLFIMTKTKMAVLGGMAIFLAIAFGMGIAAEKRLLGEISALEDRMRVVKMAEDAQRSAAQERATLDEAVKAKAIDPVQAEIDVLQKKVRRGSLDGQYARLFRRLKLTPERLEIFKDLLVDWQLAADEASRLASAERITRSEDVQKIRWSGAEDVAEQIRLFLGDESYGCFKFYVSSLSARGNLAMLDRWLTNQGVGLSDEQYEGLVKLRAQVAGDKIMNAMAPVDVESALAQLRPDQQRLFTVWNEFNGAWAEISRMNREAAARGKIKLPKVAVDDKNGTTRFTYP